MDKVASSHFWQPSLLIPYNFVTNECMQVHDLLFVERRYSTVLCMGSAASGSGIIAGQTKHMIYHDGHSSGGSLFPEARSPEARSSALACIMFLQILFRALGC
jgi:hypothetical protein